MPPKVRTFVDTRNQSLLRPVMPELDVLRGLAILGVVFLHGFYWQYSGYHFGKTARIFLEVTQPGWLGVNLFFVLSGFLITGILLDSSGRSDYYRRFYTRRALRILPAYYSLLIFLGLLGQAGTGYLLLGFVYLANVTEFFGVAQAYGPLWSLAVEEHFYLFWPAVVRRCSRRVLIWCAIAVCILVPVLRAISFRLGYTAGLAEYTWFVIDGLAAGGLLALFLRTDPLRTRVVRVSGVLLIGSSTLALLGAPFGILTRNRILGAALQHTIISVLFSGLLLVFLLVGTGPWARLVNSRPLRFLGYISYGLYLIHLLVFRLYDKFCQCFAPGMIPRNDHFELVVIRFLISGGLALLAAFLSRRYFEDRFLRLKDRLSEVRASQNRSIILPTQSERTF